MVRALWREERDHWLHPRSYWGESFSTGMSKTRLSLECIGDWVSHDSCLLLLVPFMVPFKLSQAPRICSSEVSSTFSSCFQRRQTRLTMLCSGRVPTLCSRQGCSSHSPSCGIRIQPLLVSPLIPLFSPPHPFHCIPSSSTLSLAFSLPGLVPAPGPFFWARDCNLEP